jgi:hypothetical protein
LSISGQALPTRLPENRSLQGPARPAGNHRYARDRIPGGGGKREDR